MILGRAHMEKHYADLSKKPFFKDLVDYMISGPVVCMVWEGLGAVKCGRMMLGETNPQASLPGSIRGDMSIQVSYHWCNYGLRPPSGHLNVRVSSGC